MASESETKPILYFLQKYIKLGNNLSLRPNLDSRVVDIWAKNVCEYLLPLVYGKEPPKINFFWCPDPKNALQQMSAKEKLEILNMRLIELSSFLQVPDNNNKIFIGHGGSNEWYKLYHFLTCKLALQCDDFNAETTAGFQTSFRIENMLKSARMAFLVMTAENRHEDKTMHARENVIHEIGLFQAKLQAHRAIVLIEDGCSRFSNLDGLTTIEFSPDNIDACFEKIHQVLIREGILQGI
jgi:hypothetical protein